MVEADNNSPNREQKSKIDVPIWLIAVIACFACFVVLSTSRDGKHKIPPRHLCAANLRALASAMLIYASENDQEKLPVGSKWSDLLIQIGYATTKQVLCPKSDAIKGESSYAINENVAGKTISQIPEDVVLLFETDFGRDPNGRQGLLRGRQCFAYLGSSDPETRIYKLRWNQAGGPEILTTQNHNGKGCNVVFADLSIKFITPHELDKLKWK